MSETPPATRAATGGIPQSGGVFWRQALAPYAQPHLGRSLLDMATSVVPYLVLSVVMYLALGVSYLLVLAIAIPAAGFLVRTFIVFHDCSHGSFLVSKRANAWLGIGARAARLLPVCALAPRPCDPPRHIRRPGPARRWRRPHADRRRVPRAAVRGRGWRTACSATRS